MSCRAIGIGSQASVYKYISGLTEGSLLIPFCPQGKSSGIGAVEEMADGFRACRIFKKKNMLGSGYYFEGIDKVDEHIGGSLNI